MWRRFHTDPPFSFKPARVRLPSIRKRTGRGTAWPGPARRRIALQYNYRMKGLRATHPIMGAGAAPDRQRGITIEPMRVLSMSLVLHIAPNPSPVLGPRGRRKPASPPARPARRCLPRPAWARLVADGEQACFQAWERIRDRPPASWLALPPARGANWREPAYLLRQLSSAGAAHPALAFEVERSLARGASSTTALCLMLLAALAHGRYGGGEPALALARAALRMTQAQDSAGSRLVAAAHAALLLPAVDGLAQAAATLARLGACKPLPDLAALYLGGAAFAAGMSVPELSRYLELARSRAPAGDAARRELDGRGELLRGLLSRQGAGILRRLCAAPDHSHDERFGAWLTRLQAAWYAGDAALALEAVDAAGALAGPLTPAGDLLLYHAFAVLALAGDQAPDAPHVPAALRRHSEALRTLDERTQASGGALSALAHAACDRHGGGALAALRGFEQAASLADARGLHWLAALAAEQAALLAQGCALDSAARHYRRQALVFHQRWGALGRLEVLQAAWGDCPPAKPPRQGPARPAMDNTRCAALSIAHELNQPLAAVTLHAAAAAKWLRRAEPDLERALDSLALIGAAGRQAGDIVRGMQRLASGQTVETAGVDLDAAVREALHLLQRPLRRHGIALELALGLDGCAIDANRVQLQQVVTNLVLNAIEAHAGAGLPGARRIRVETRHANAHEIELAVSDNGPGIAPANRERVFTSLFSTKPRRKVGGMGLSISLSIVRAHGGHVWFEPCAARGACFRLRLPTGMRQKPS